MKLRTWVRLAATALILAVAVVWTGIQPAMADVKADFTKNCVKCHAEDGSGNNAMGKKLNVQDWTAAAYKSDKATIVKAIDDGVAKTADRGKMPSYKGKVDSGAMADYVLSLKK